LIFLAIVIPFLQQNRKFLEKTGRIHLLLHGRKEHRLPLRRGKRHSNAKGNNNVLFLTAHHEEQTKENDDTEHGKQDNSTQ